MSQMMHAVASQLDMQAWHSQVLSAAAYRLQGVAALGMQTRPVAVAFCDGTLPVTMQATPVPDCHKWRRCCLRRLASMSQMVQVVSMLEVPRRLGSVSFQSKEVRGAQNSEFLFCSAARRAWGLACLTSVRACLGAALLIQMTLSQPPASQERCMCRMCASGGAAGAVPMHLPAERGGSCACILLSSATQVDGCHAETCKRSPSTLRQLLQQPLRLSPSRLPLIVEMLLQTDPSSCKVQSAALHHRRVGTASPSAAERLVAASGGQGPTDGPDAHPCLRQHC